MKSTELRNKKVVIAPFNTEAVFLYHRLIRDGIEVVAFMDTDMSLHNERYKGTMIIPWFHFEDEVAAVIATPGYVSEQEIYQELIRVGYRDSEIMRQREIEHICQIGDIVDDIDLPGLSKIRNFYWMYLLKSKIYQYTAKDGLFSKALTLFVTTRCTLRCKGCSELMDYFRPKDQKDMDLDGTVNSFRLLMEHLDFVDEVVVIGGETFLYKDLDKLLTHIASNEYAGKIGRVGLVTNGTILPSKKTLEILGENRHLFQVRISDYGKASFRKLELLTLLNQNNCYYVNVMCDAWNLMYQPIVSDEGLTRDEILKKCNNCVCHGNGMLKVIENKVYSCIFTAMAAECHAIPQDRRNYLDLHIDGISRDSLRKFIGDVQPGMAYCSGAAVDASGNKILLPIGEQVATVHECMRYDE